LFFVVAGSGFDVLFVAQEYILRNLQPRVILNGTRIYELYSARAKNLRFRDSYLFMQLPLRQLSATFDIPETKKGYFPYLLIDPANYNLKLNCLPPIEAYGTEHWRQEQLDEFLEFYRENQHRPFSFRQAIYEYTKSDVELLRKVGYVCVCVCMCMEDISGLLEVQSADD
jgi:hypothetical protein